MSWSNVQSWIDGWAFTPAATTRGKNGFKHFKGASRSNLPVSRGWWVEPVDASAALVGSLSGRYRQTVTIDLVVAYPHDVEGELLHAAIIADYEVITRYLANPTNWDYPTSTVVAISPFEPRFPAQIEQIDRATLLTVRITIKHEVTT